MLLIRLRRQVQDRQRVMAQAWRRTSLLAPAARAPMCGQTRSCQVLRGLAPRSPRTYTPCPVCPPQGTTMAMERLQAQRGGRTTLPNR